MKYKGPLGFRRFSSIGPFVECNICFSAVLDSDTASEIIDKVVEEEDVPLSNMSDEEFDRAISGIARKIYPGESPVQEAKRERFKICMKNRWVVQWTRGMEEGNDSISINTDAQELELRAKGCAGFTEANTSDNEQLVPAQYK